MAEAACFFLGKTTVVLRDDLAESDPEAARRHLERIGGIYRKYLMEEEKKRAAQAPEKLRGFFPSGESGQSEIDGQPCGQNKN